MDVNSNTEVFFGSGLDLDSVGFVVGAKFWPNDNVRLTMNYGPNCIVDYGSYYKSYA